MRKLLIFHLLLLCFSCNNSPNNIQEVEQATFDKKISADSIKLLFNYYLGAREDFFPSSQIYEFGKLNPVDQAVIDTSFFIFREKLLEAVQKKDIFFLLDHTNEHIFCSFDGSNTLEEFVELWDLASEESATQSKLWVELEKVLRLGGTFDKADQTFSANYIFSTFPEQYDPYDYAAIVGSGVRLRSAPNLQSKIIKTVSYNIVKVLDWDGPEEKIGGEVYNWAKIALLDDTEAYVYGKYLISPIDYRAGFKQKSGKWEMTFFVAGD